jgi:hypothetical protein
MYSEGEKGYPLVFFQKTPSWIASFLTGLLIAGVGGIFFAWYSRTSPDPTPDSTAGFAYAIIGTLLLSMAALLYTLRRRVRKRAVGQLHVALNWHICFGTAGLVMLFMHSFGNFNPRSGTYALFGMIALVISGFVGRLLDHVLPRLIAIEVRKALTAQGNDRLESITQQLQAIVTHNTQKLAGFSTNQPEVQGLVKTPAAQGERTMSLNTPWDLAYISLEETPQEINLDARQYRLVPDKKSVLTRPGALLPGAQEQIAAMAEVERALQREQFYRYVIRYWRIFHVVLALLTVGLTLWHIEYALQLLIPTLLQH